MKIASITMEGGKGTRELPEQFNEAVNPDLIKRAVLFEQSLARKPYGSYKEAGKGYAVTVYKRRRHYRGSYGIGISRVPRKVMSRRGARFRWTGAFAPGTVGGRRAHPPKAEKVWKQKMNKKEYLKAIRSALTATSKKELVSKRGHRVPDTYPVALSKSESISRTKNAKQLLEKIGLKEEMQRTKKRNVRAGKGKRRGRKYKGKKGVLLVVSKNCPLTKAARNIPGVDIKEVDKLNAGLLAPGASVGRLTIFTEEALDRMEKEGLFERV